MNETVFQILALLRSEPATSAQLFERFRNSLARPPALATFYRALHRAMEDGWICRDEPIASGGPGRPRHVFRLTGPGLLAVRAQARKLRELTELVLDNEPTSS